MSSRWILSLLIAFSLTMAGMFYVALKKGPGFKSQIASQMQTEFADFALKTKHVERIQVAEVGGQKFSVPVQGAWKFEIRDKVLYVLAPLPESESGQTVLPSEQIPAAKKSIEDFLWNWIDERFHSRKDLQLDVHFPNEPQAQ